MACSFLMNRNNFIFEKYIRVQFSHNKFIYKHDSRTDINTFVVAHWLQFGYKANRT